MIMEDTNIIFDENNPEKMLISIEQMSKRIKSRKICNLNKIELYSETIEKLDSKQNEYGISLDSLDKFATSANTLSDLIELIIERYEKLLKFNYQTSLTQLYKNFQTIDRYTYLSEKLSTTMQKLDQTDFYQKHTTQIKNIQHISDILNDLELNSTEINNSNNTTEYPLTESPNKTTLKEDSKKELEETSNNTQKEPSNIKTEDNNTINIWIVIVLCSIILVLIIIIVKFKN